MNEDRTLIERSKRRKTKVLAQKPVPLPLCPPQISGIRAKRRETKHLIHGKIQRKWREELECVWNVMAHAQKPDFVFRRNGWVHLNRRGRQFSPTIGSRGIRISGSNAGYTMFRGSVKGTGYPLHSPVSASLPLPCVTVFHHISTRLYIILLDFV
jgi:hypothetical protein